MPLSTSRGPSPFSGTASYRPDPMSIDDELHPVIHASRVAVITGAASGIGRAAAEEFAKYVFARSHDEIYRIIMDG